MELPKPYFRFVNDFSNKYLFPDNAKASGTLSLSNGDPIFESEGMSDGILLGSKRVVHFTNDQIKSGEAKRNGLIDYKNYTERETKKKYVYRSTEAEDSYDISGLVGAYKITNETGVTYHYALPVYAYEEFQRHQKKDDPGIYTQYDNKEPYAYTWLLTAITGPDFVDRGGTGSNGNGILDNEDWGYWVKFDYGKWTDKYGWRTPSEGYIADIVSDVETYSFGYKEIYYLNKISTKTHVAIFEKELRADAKSVPNDAEFDSRLDDGGFEPRIFNYNSNNGWAEVSYSYPIYPISSMKLNNIYLIDKNYDIDLTNKSDKYNHRFSYTANYIEEDESFTNEPFTVTHHQGENVIDKFDLDEMKSGSDSYRDFLTNHAIRVISFDHSYELQGEVPNSFDKNGSMYSETLKANKYIKLGKLTLEAIDFKGKNGSQLIPSMNFYYDYENPVQGTGTIKGTWMKGASADIARVGTILNINNDEAFAVITEINDNDFKLKKIGEGSLPSGSVTCVKTKNPPFNQEYYDAWGFFKSDYEESESELLSRTVTPESASNVDAWSLCGIKTSLGSKISFEYESDEYTQALYFNSELHIKSIKVVDESTGQLELTFHNDVDLLQMSGQILNKNLSTSVMLRYRGEGNFYACEGSTYGTAYYYHNVNNTSKIIGVNSNSIIIQNSELSERYLREYNYRCWRSDTGAIWVDTNGGSCSWTFNDAVLTAGVMAIDDPNALLSPYGGGVRVSSISVDDGNTVRSTKFNYRNGVTAMEPNSLEAPFVMGLYSINSCLAEIEQTKRKEFNQSYYDLIYGELQELLLISREIPAPGVVYEYVTVSEEVDDRITPSKQEYQFQVFEKDFVERVPINGTSSISPLTIRDFTTRVGNLKKIKTYGENDQLLLEKQTLYQHDLESDNVTLRNSFQNEFNSQGVTHELFTEYRIVDGSKHQKVFSRKEHYPAIQSLYKTINYKTGVTTTTRNLAFDFYSGQVTYSYTKDGYGNSYVSKSVPAYRFYPEMAQKNMLTQEGASYRYLMDDDSFNPDNFSYSDKEDIKDHAIGLVSARAQSWDDGISVKWGNANTSQYGIFRKQASFSYVGKDTDTRLIDGTIDINDFNEFSLNAAISEASGWQTDSEITLYDINSHALEAKDINGNYAATKFDLNNERVIATAANAEYNEFTFSGAEGPIDGASMNGGVILEGERVEGIGHTGNFWVSSTAAAKKGFSYTMLDPPSEKYLVSFWTTASSSTIKYRQNGGTVRTSEVGNLGFSPVGDDEEDGWYLIQGTVPAKIGGGPLEIWTEGGNTYTLQDDFRIHPIDATMSSYVYNEWGELSDILDVNNLFTHYEYDAMGRLKSVTRETLKHGPVKVSETIITYGNQD